MLVSYSASTQARSTDGYDQLFLQAQSMMDSGAYDNTVQLLNEISSNELSEANDTTKVFYNTIYGKALFFQQKNDSAINYLAAAIDYHEAAKFKFPSYIDMMAFRAFANDAIGNREEALRWYRKALIKSKVIEHNLDMDNNCYLNIGNILNESGDYPSARQYYDKIHWVDTLQKVEIHADYWGRRAGEYLEYSRAGMWNKAKLINDSLTNYSLTKYGEVHPYYLCCLQNDGVIQNSTKDYKSAEIAYNKLILLGRENNLTSDYVGDAYIRLIEILCNQDKLDKAIEIFPQAISYLKNLNNPNHSEVEPCLYIGMASVRIDDYEVGVMALEKFLDYIPEYMQWGAPYAINKLTWAYLNTGRNQEVIDMLSPLLDNIDSMNDSFKNISPYLYKTLGCSYYVIGQKDNAISSLHRAIALLPEQMGTDSLIQEILTELGDVQ